MFPSEILACGMELHERDLVSSSNSYAAGAEFPEVAAKREYRGLEDMLFGCCIKQRKMMQLSGKRACKAGAGGRSDLVPEPKVQTYGRMMHTQSQL